MCGIEVGLLLVIVIRFLLIAKNYLLVLLLLLDLFGLRVLIGASIARGRYFITMIILLVYSSILGVVVLIRRVRKTGKDKIICLL